MCVGWRHIANQKGIILYETAVSIAVIAMLFMTAITIFIWGIKMYFWQVADGELEQEVQIAFQEIMEESLRAKKIEKWTKCGSYVFYKKNNPLEPKKEEFKPTEDVIKTTYEMRKVDGVMKLICSDDAPLTGNHELAPVEITSFTIDEDAQWTGVYRVQLAGRSGVTNHEYSLCSAVCISEE